MGSEYMVGYSSVIVSGLPVMREQPGQSTKYEIPTLRPSEFPTSQNRNSDRRVRDRFHVAAFKAVTRRPFVQDSLGGLSRKYDSGSSPDEPLLLRCALIAPSGKTPPVSLATTHF